MNLSSQTIKRATIGIALMVLLSKGVGFLREMIIAYRFGTGIDYDVYLIAVSIPMALYSLFGYAFSNLFIPTYGYAVSGADKKSALRALWSDFNFSLIAAVALTVGIILMAPAILRMIAPGLAAEYLPEAVMIIKVSSVVVILAVLEAFFRSVLNAEKHFLIPAAGPLMANLILIIFILLFAGRISTRAILYGLVVGYACQVIVTALAFRKTAMPGFFQWRLLRKHTDNLFETAVVILAVASALQVYSIADRYFASSMSPGIVSAFGYATLLVMMVVDIIAFAFSTAIFPYLIDAFAGKDRVRGTYLLHRGIRMSLLFAMPLTVVMWVFSDKLILLLFQRGAFDLQSVEYTSRILKYFSLSLTGQFILMFMSRVYYAAHKQALLALAVMIGVAVKIILAAPAIKLYGYIALPITSSIGYTLAALVLIMAGNRFLLSVDWKNLLKYFIKLAVAASITYFVAMALMGSLVADKSSFGSLLLILPVAIGISLATFLAMGFVMRVDEIRDLSHILEKWKARR